MAIQDIKLGTQPSGAGGDTNRSANVKINENFSNPQHAASRMVGGLDSDVAEYRKCFGGAYGTQVDEYITTSTANIPDEYKSMSKFPIGNRVLIAAGATSDTPYTTSAGSLFYVETKSMYSRIGGRMQKAWAYGSSTGEWSRYAGSDNIYGTWRYNLTSANTTKDANGFLKAASPVINLFCDHIELNADAEQQPITFEKLGTGDYLVKGSSGFAQEGWYIEQPKDANGNVLVAVVYEQLENNDISVKTFKKKFDIETASIVADIDNPVDVPKGRWIDLRLQELPQEDVEVFDEPEQ